MEIQRKTGIPYDEQKLFIGERELLDHEFVSLFSYECIEFYHFPKGSKLIYIDFDTNLGKFCSFIIFNDHLLVKSIMQKLHKLTCLEYFPEETALMFNGKKLDINKTLEDYTSLHESEKKLTFTVHFESRKISDHFIQIFVRSIYNRSFIIKASPFDTVAMIRYDISIKEGLQKYTRLFCNGKLLRDSNTLQDYNMHNYSILQIISRLRG